MRLLFIVPLYGVCSFVSLVVFEASPFIEVLRDIYEAFVIYCFLNLMLTFGGGEHHIAVSLMDSPPMRHPPPLCCLRPIILNSAFVKNVKRGTLQFVICKLIFAVISVGMIAGGKNNDPAWENLNLAVYNIAYSVALYFLFLFYLATHDIVATMSPARKFIAIKTIVFLTYWQELLVGLGPGSKEEANRWNDFVLCCEMPLFAYLQFRAFPWFEFQSGVPGKSWLAAAGEVMSVRDVAADLMHNVKPAYQEYTLNTQAQGVTDATGKYVGSAKKKYRTRTFLIGNIGAEAKQAASGDQRSGRKKKRGKRGSYSLASARSRDASRADDDNAEICLDLPDVDFKPDASMVGDLSAGSGSEDAKEWAKFTPEKELGDRGNNVFSPQRGDFELHEIAPDFPPDEEVL